MNVLRKVLGALVLGGGSFIVFVGLFGLLTFKHPNDQGFLFVMLFFGAAVVLVGTLIWEWKRKKAVFGVISIVLGAVLGLMAFQPVIMKSAAENNPKVAEAITQLSMGKPLAGGIIFIIIGIWLKIAQKKMDAEAKNVKSSEEITG